MHAAYLHNRRVHRVTKKTPFEAWTGRLPNLKDLKVFGVQVCVKQTGKRRAKLDRHDFTGIFLGYTATEKNIRYIDVTSGVTKSCHHAVFDEAWYLQPTRPPAAQLLYDLGLVEEEDFDIPTVINPLPVAYYLPKPTFKHISVCVAHQFPLPLWLTATPQSVAARAAKLSTADPYKDIVLETFNKDGSAVVDYHITIKDIAQIYVSPHPFNDAFEEHVDLRRYDESKHAAAELRLTTTNSRLILDTIDKSTPCARIPRWRSRLKGAWLIQVGDTRVSTLDQVKQTFRDIHSSTTPPPDNCTLLFSHPEMKHGLTNEGIPQVNLDQLNPRLAFEQKEFPIPLLTALRSNRVKKFWDDDVLHYVTMAMRLTRRKLLKQEDWADWQQSEYAQLDQYAM